MAEINFVTFFNSYKSMAIIGEGGSGLVYKVKDKGQDIHAIKCLKTSGETKRKRFQNELSFCSQNVHKNIIKIEEYGVTQINGEECQFYVMPYYPSTLRILMRQGIPNNKVIGYFSQILDGVEAAHLKSIWHRDLKPENILYDPPSETLLVADFGIAHFIEEYLQTSLQTNSHERMGNFQYAAPEQRTTGKTIDHKADIFALGLILNEMFTGEILQGTGYRTIGSVAPDFAYLDDIVDGMVRQLPEERPSSIQLIKQQLIVKGNEFISLQKLSNLKKIVIPQSEVDDPLVIEPVTLLSIVDYKEGKLILRLSQSVTQEWVQVFYKAHHRQTLIGGNPSDFSFSGNSVIKNAAEGTAQRIVDYFKDYLSTANEAYKNHVLQKQHQREEEERQKLQTQVEEEERRQRILKNIRI